MNFNHQFRVLDSLRFNAISIFQRTEEAPYDPLIIGKDRVNRPMELNNRLFIDPILTRNSNEDMRIGLSLAGSLNGMNINIHGKIGKEIREMMGSYSPMKFIDISDRRVDLDLDTIKGGNALWMDLSGNEPVNGEIYRENDLLPPEVVDHRDLIHFIDMLKELTDIPVIASIRGLDVKNDLDKVLVSSVDAINIRIGYSTEEIGSIQGPISDPVTSIIDALNHFRVFRSKEKGVKLLLSGPIRDGMDVVKLRCLGVDGVCPSMALISEIEKLDLDDTIDWAVLGENFGGTINEIMNSSLDITNTLNVKEPSDLKRDLLMVDDYHSAALTGLPLAGYGQEIPFWKH